MGYQTDFYGKLRFNRKLDESELGWIQEVIHGPRCYSSRIRSEYIDTHLANWDNERDNAQMDLECDRDLRSKGFVVTEGSSYADLTVSNDRDGLGYRSEKSYDLVSGVNFIIANARVRIPDFGLRGSLFASTEFEPHQWLLKINSEGRAEQVPCRLTDLPVADQTIFRKERNRKWLQWSQRCALIRLSDRHKIIYAGFERHCRVKYGDGCADPRNGFLKAADAVCFGVIKVASRVQGRISHERFRLKHGRSTN